MNKRMIMLMAVALALLSAYGHVTFTGVDPRYDVIAIKPDITTGLDTIFVIYDTQGVSMTYTATTDEEVAWNSFELRDGELRIDPIDNIVHAGAVTTLAEVMPGKGYKIEEGTDPHFYWVVNYADHFMELNSLTCNNENPCGLPSIEVDGHADEIPYVTTNGIRQVLDREIKLCYETQVWNDSTHWKTVPMEEIFESLAHGVAVSEPLLVDTEVLLTRDRFLEKWGLGNATVSDYYYTRAVKCYATADQEIRDYENEQGNNTDSEALGGSAPVHIVFTGYPSEGAVVAVWELSMDSEFEELERDFNQDEVDYTFNDYGTYYMRYRVENADHTCEDSKSFTIDVGESKLIIPNVFMPGVDEKWTVRYQSLLEFHCWIFNRWGNLVCEFTDPGIGWDGKYRGKLVDPGVYYYVIDAVGSDGVRYKNKRGSITILLYKHGAAGNAASGAGAGY